MRLCGGLACSKCLKVFPTHSFGEKPDYSGYDRTAWIDRDLVDHKESCAKHKVSDTHSAQLKLEREHGCRYSVLLELPYFNPIRMTIVDPMHNLLLGTAKHMFTIWSDLELIGPQKLKVIQGCVDSLITPGDVGEKLLQVFLASQQISGVTGPPFSHTEACSPCTTFRVLAHVCEGMSFTLSYKNYFTTTLRG